jgi:hypothetical protein
VFSKDGIAPGEGRTSVSLSSSLDADRTYYWRARAQDGANTGPFAAALSFRVRTPVVFGAPVLVSPVGGARIAGLPVFVFLNASRTGPVGSVGYTIQLAKNDTFTSMVAELTVSEQGGQTSYTLGQGLESDRLYYWHVRAFDEKNVGPWSATQTFRTPTDTTPAPSPTPTPTPTPTPQPGQHVGPGPLTAARAEQVVYATAREFPSLLAVFPSEEQAVAAAEQLLLRTIWHLQLAGFQSGRQRNPSGAISNDKLTIFIDGNWHLYDIYRLGYAGVATTVQFMEIDMSGANHIPSSGIAD